MRPVPAILTRDQLDVALVRVPGWRATLAALHTAYSCTSAASALALVAGIGAAAQRRDHHPELDWRYDHVFLRLTTHQVGDVTNLDVELAVEIDELAAAAGASARPELVRPVEIGVDAPDPERLKALWRSVLGYRENRAGDLVDPWARGPWVWFQGTPTPAESRLHLDVHVPPERAEQVVAEAVAAGASADSAHAPSWWVLADPDGNRFCVCTPADPPAGAE